MIVKIIAYKLGCLMAALLPLACAFGGTAASVEPTEAYPDIQVFQTVEITLEVGETFTTNSYKQTPSRYWLLGSVKGNTVAKISLTDAAGTLMQMEETDAYSGFTQRSTTTTKSVAVTVTAAKPGTERIFLGRQKDSSTQYDYKNESSGEMDGSQFAVDTLLIVKVNGEIPTSPITYVDVPEDVENPNPTSFTDDDLPITLKPLEDRDDYTFEGWSPTNVIPRGTEGDQTFTAVWKEIPKIVGHFCVTPYLQRPSTDAMTIIFFTDAPCRATVTCGLSGRGDVKVVGGVVPNAPQTKRTVGEWAEALTNNLNVGESSVWKNSLYRHRVRFDGLMTNRSYDYTVTLTGGATYSDTFRTAPDRDTPIRFVSYADCETTKTPHSNYVKNLTQMKGHDPDFITVSGDLVAKGGLQENWDGFWQANAGTSGTIAGSIPVLTVIGNHDLFDNGLPGHSGGLYYDMQGEPSTARFLSYFEVESNGVDFASAPWPHTETRDLSQLFHRVDYGPVTLIFLDTNNGDDSDHDKDTNYLDRNDGQHLQGGLDRNLGCRHPDFNVGSPQYVWLTNNLAEAQAKSRFTFVFNHHCPYSRGTHNNDWRDHEDGSALALRFLTETFVRYGVDGWYCGHDELLEHSVTTGTEVLPDGTARPHTLSIYDLGGSGDSARNTGSLNNPLEYNFMGNYSSGGYGFLETDVAMDANGRWTCTVTPYSAGKGAYESDRMIYVESCAQESGKNDLVSAEHGGISGIPSTAPSGWLAWERPPEGTAWDESVEVELSEVTAADLTYDGTVQTPHLMVMAGDLVVPRDHCTVSAWTKAGETAPSDLKDAGMYTATVTGLGNVKGEAQVSVTIGRVTATVTANPATKEFGAANPQFDATVTGLQGNDTQSCLKYSFTCAADESTPAGTTCPIVVEAAETQGNYTVVCVNGTLTVTKPQPRPSETTAVTASITYGQNLSAANGTVSGTMTDSQGKEVVGTFAFKSGTTVPPSGTSTHTAVFTPDDDNYDSVEVDVEVTVAKATLTVKPVDMTVHSGDPAPDYAFDFEGFVNGDTKAKVAGKPVFSCGYTTASEEGATHEIRVTGVGTLSAADYDFVVSDETATLTVTKKVDEGTQWQSSYTIQEGETTGVIWAEYLKSGVAQTRWWKLDGGNASIAAPEFVDANPNEPKMSGSPLSRAKFTFTGVTAGTTTWKAYTYTDEGKVPGYKTAGGSGSWSDGSGVSITITVTPKPRQIVSAIAANATYAGNVQTPTVVVMAEGGVTVPAGSFTVGAWSPSEPKDVGTYTATVTGTQSYFGETTVSFTIDPAQVTVRADDKSREFGVANPTLTATVTGLQGGDDKSCLTYALTCAADESTPLGTTCPIVVEAAETQGNYTVVCVNGTLTVAEKVDEGTQWQSSYTIQEGETTGVIWAEYLKSGVAQTRWWKLDGGNASIAAPEFVDANPNEPKMSGSPLSRAKFTFTGVTAGTTTWTAYTYTDEGKVPGYTTAGGTGSWSANSGVSITITVTPKPRQIVSATAANARYTGGVQTPAVVVMAEGGVTVPAGSYTVGAWSPSAPKDVGTYTATVTSSSSSYFGETTVSFTIDPLPTTVEYTGTVEEKDVGDDTVYIFKSDGTLTLPTDARADILVVGGGGSGAAGGSSKFGKSGTGGAVSKYESIGMPAGLYSITVGAGGQPSAQKGGDSTLSGPADFAPLTGKGAAAVSTTTSSSATAGTDGTNAGTCDFAPDATVKYGAGGDKPTTGNYGKPGNENTGKGGSGGYGSGKAGGAGGSGVVIVRILKPVALTEPLAAEATYNGAEQTPTFDGIAVELVGWDGTPKDVGEYHCTARGTGRFTGEVGVTFTITRAPVTVTADDNHMAPGDPEPGLTATVTGLQGGDPKSCIVYSISREAGDGPGEYEIFVTGDAEQGNYDVTFVNGTFTIREKAIFEPGQDVVIEVSGPTAVDVGEKAISVGKVTIKGTGELTISNCQNLTASSIDLTGLSGTNTYEYVSSSPAADSPLPSGLADAIKAQTDQKVKYAFRSTSDANGWNLGSWDRTTFKTHIVIGRGTHTWSQNNNSSGGGSKFGENGTDENPTLLVKDGATLDFTAKDLSGYQNGFVEGGVIRVNAGGTLNFLKPSGSNPNMNYRQRLVLDPGSLTTFAYGTDRFVLHGAGATPGTATEETANVYVPASDGTAGPAILRCASSNGAGLCINNTSNGRGGGCAIWVGANSKLLLDSKVSKGEENDSTSNKRILAKLGPGELEITGEVTTSVDFDARAGIITLPAGQGSFGKSFTATADVTYRFPEGWAADTPYALGSDAVTGTAPAEETATVYVGAEKLTGMTLVYSDKTVKYMKPHEPTPFELLCAAALAGEAYVFEDDMEFPADGVLTVPAGAEFVLDLKGRAITCHADGAIVNNGKLTIVDSAKAGPLQAHVAYSAAEQGAGRTLIRNAAELVLDGVFVDAGFVDGANSVFGGGNTAIAATGGSVTVKNGAHVGGRTAIAASGDAKVVIDGAHVAGWRWGGAVAEAATVRDNVTLFVSNATMEAEGHLVRTVAVSATSAVTIVDSTLASSYTTAPFDLGRGAAVTIEKSIYVDRMAKWFPVTTALANDGADLRVGAGCLLAVASESVIGFLDEGVTAGEVAPRVWRTKGADDEALPPLTDEEKSRIAEVLSSSPDKLLKASVTEVKDYMAYRAWVDKGVEAGTIDSQAAAKGAEGSFFSFATDQDRIVDPAGIDDSKVKIEEVKVNNGGVTLTVGIDGVPVGENAQAKYLEKVFGVTGTAALDEEFAADKVKYGNMQNNGDGTVSYTAEPNVEPKPDAFFFRATVETGK